MSSGSLFRSGGVAAIGALVILLGSFLAYGITQEIPVGQLKGRVVLDETGKPLANAAIVLRPKTNDSDQNVRVRMIRADAKGQFNLRNLPAAIYEVDVMANAHELPKTSVVVEEGRSKELTLQLKPLDPYLTLYANQHVFMPKEEPSVQVHGFVRAKALDVRLYEVPSARLLETKDFYRAFSPIASAQTPADIVKNAPGVKLVQQFEWPIRPTDGEGTFKRQLALSRLKPGFYFLRLQAGEPEKGKPAPPVRGTYLLITEVGLVAKRAKGKIHLYATDLETGKPRANVPVTLAQAEWSREVGTTDDNGLLSVDLPPAQQNSSAPTALLASAGTSQAVVTFSDWNNDDSRMRFYIHTDRPIYRPGDRVFFRAIARVPNGPRWSLPTDTTANIEIQDSEGTVLKRDQVPMSAMGTFSGDFQLPEGSTSGVRLITRVGSVESERFIYVMAYRKPEFKITATPVKPFYLRGDTVQMRVKAEYYFGGPVVGAKLSGYVSRGPLWSWTDPDSGEDVLGSEGGDGEFAGDVAGTTDNNGEALLTFDSKQIKYGTWEDVDHQLTFSISGTEGDDRYFDTTGTVNLLRGDLSLKVDQDEWVVAPGSPTTLTVKLADPSGDARPQDLQRSVEVVTGYQLWDDKGSVFQAEKTEVLTTNADGTATVNVTPPNPGEYRVKVRVKDRGGRTVEASAWLWVYQAGFEFGGPQPDLQVILDKKTYEVGDTVSALVRGAKTGSAWVTLETDGVLEQKVVDLSSGMARVEFQVTEDLKPNAFVAASLVHEKRYAEARRRLSVYLSAEKLTISVKPDKQVYKPGETATYAIRAVDSKGRPARAEIALGIVDEAIYAIAEDSDDPMQTFYPIRSSLVNTYNSFPELYLDGGEKGATDIEIRDDFRDTAAWMPTVLTDADGNAEVTLKLPDNLTSWRATATAIDSDTRVGKTKSNLIVRKDLMVRLATPMMLTQRDELTLTSNVNNGTDSPMNVAVTLKTTGAEIESSAEQTIALEPNRGGQVSWRIALPNPGEATFEVIARSASGQTDGMRASVPVQVYGRRIVEGAAGELAAGETKIQFNIDPTSPEAELRMLASPTLLAPIVGSLDKLVDFPYGCAEQTTNRFVPTALAKQLMAEFGIADPALSEKIEEVTRLGLQRLKQMQHPTGGWGWFETAEPSSWSTSIVLEGLARGRDAGVQVDRVMLSNGLDWAKRRLRSAELKSDRPEDRIRLAAAVLRLEANEDAVRVLRAEPFEWVSVNDPKVKESLDMEALTFIVMGLHKSTDAGAVARRMAALDRIWAAADQRQDSIVWADSWGVRNTARALEAIETVSPDDPRIIQIVRGMLLMRRADGWTSTLDTGLAVTALMPVLRKTGGVGDSSVEVLVNGRVVEPRQSAGSNTGMQDFRLKRTDLKSGANEVVIRRTGGGIGFFAWNLSQIPSTPSLPALETPGLKVERTFHSLGAQRMEDGSMQLMPSKQAIQSMKSGEVVRCRVVVTSRAQLEFAMIEVPLPSNMRVQENTDPDWSYWYSGRNVLDDRVAFFATTVSSGTNVIEFNLRAEAVGKSQVLPANVMEMYAPDRSASSEGSVFEVTR